MKGVIFVWAGPIVGLVLVNPNKLILFFFFLTPTVCYVFCLFAMFVGYKRMEQECKKERRRKRERELVWKRLERETELREIEKKIWEKKEKKKTKKSKREKKILKYFIFLDQTFLSILFIAFSPIHHSKNQPLKLKFRILNWELITQSTTLRMIKRKFGN